MPFILILIRTVSSKLVSRSDTDSSSGFPACFWKSGADECIESKWMSPVKSTALDRVRRSTFGACGGDRTGRGSATAAGFEVSLGFGIGAEVIASACFKVSLLGFGTLGAACILGVSALRVLGGRPLPLVIFVLDADESLLAIESCDTLLKLLLVCSRGSLSSSTVSMIVPTVSAARRERFCGSGSKDPSVRSKDTSAVLPRNDLRLPALGAASASSHRSIEADTGFAFAFSGRLLSGDPSMESYLNESSSAVKKICEMSESTQNKCKTNLD